MPFKIAYGAGHRLVTAGKKSPKETDPNQTKEWTVNDRAARYFAEAAAQYEDVELLRVDEPAGMATVAGLTKKKEQETIYRVQVGAYHNKANAEAMKADLESECYQAMIVALEI